MVVRAVVYNFPLGRTTTPALPHPAPRKYGPHAGGYPFRDHCGPITCSMGPFIVCNSFLSIPEVYIFHLAIPFTGPICQKRARNNAILSLLKTQSSKRPPPLGPITIQKMIKISWKSASTRLSFASLEVVCCRMK